MYVVIESIKFTVCLRSGTKKHYVYCVCLRSGTKKALRLLCFCARGQKKHYVYCVFALGDTKSIAFTVFLRSGTKQAIRLLCFLLSERAGLPNGPSPGVRILRTNSLAASKNPMRTAVWGIMFMFFEMILFFNVFRHVIMFA